MGRLNKGWLQLLLKLTVLLGLLWMLYLVSWPRTGWSLTYSLGHSWLEYTDDDGGPEKVCNCSAILQGEREALVQAKLLTITKDFRKNVHIPDEYYINATQDCSEFRLSRKYWMSPLSQEEEDFPLAYSFVLHHKVQNFERLLRAIYAPQNIYCVHVDKKSEASVFAAIQAITSCFPNVFLVSKAVKVVYGHWSRVQADLNCMADLYNISTEWKYLINLCGQDFPLKTNLEIVRMLRSLKGGNSMESEQMPEHKKSRVSNSYQIVDGTIQWTSKKKGPPPFNLPILAGNAYIVVSRGYICSVLEDNRIPALIEWSKDTYAAEELRDYLNCMADLYNISTEWKYLINLCGQDFPLKTNLEIVRMLRSLKGGNSMESEQMSEDKKSRVSNSYQIVDGTIQWTSKKKGPPPFNLPILAGNAYIVVSRGYIRSVLEDNRIPALIEWSKDTYAAEECFWATIQRMPGVAGSTWPNRKYDVTDMNAIARLVKWQHHEGPQDSLQSVYPECHGHHVRSVCVYGAGDLQWMLQQHHLFANKFDIDTDPIAVYCLEKYLRHKALADADQML